ncbi:cytochrome P450 [Halocatena salina]|uniref:Cytochrome P450 n=1 Tax=Halocatena salina TaxID=2934340 RepID=A0A8U0A561_9EURY|nr:cytochrome P450 [Halocatena salina]UPM44350.1 cytochrome P450 [Halocatena salina]
MNTNETLGTETSGDSLSIPPGPNGLPLIGNTISFLHGGLDFADRLTEHGDVVRYTALGETFVVVSDPQLIESVLVSRNDEFWKGSFEVELGRLLAPNGLVFTEGEQWQTHRSLLQPEFTPERLRSHEASIRAVVSAAASEWSAEETIDLRTACSKLTLSILANTLFTIDLTTARGAVVREAASAIAARTDISRLTYIWPEWAPRTPTQRRFDRAMADLDELIEELICERRQTDTGDDLLGVLLSADAMDEDTVRDQLVTFLFAGHETTALALTYALWLLSGHPAVSERVRAERKTAPETVIKETLRLYPPTYLIYRETQHDVALGGYRISRGTTLQLPAYTVHRDPRWWNEPDAFVPDRWNETTDRPEYAYFPFGGGPRHCIGIRFAMTELNIALTELLQRLEFERITESLTPSPNALLEPGQVMMRVHQRAGDSRPT